MVALFAKCGLHNTEKYRHSRDDKYHFILRQISYNLDLPEARKDPFRKLPREIIGLILSHVDTTTLIRCCRVSKSWRQVIEPDTAIWSSIRLKIPRSSRYFAKFLQKHRLVRSLVLEDVSRLGFSAAHLKAIVGLHKLQHLYIGSKAPLGLFPDLSMGTPIEHTARVTRLSLVLQEEGSWTTWETLVRRMSPDLEVLNLRPTYDYMSNTFNIGQLSPFPKLKKLRLDYHPPHDRGSSSWVPPFSLVSSVPRVRDQYTKSPSMLIKY